ncbi:MAG: hemin uptake protein HemP [Cocleimonas sp.]|nr:hemin uptake protein HemP [Cocleimonas sp.]
MKLSELSHIDVGNMMQGNKKAVLMHNHKQYLLSVTRRGKLILTLAEEKTDSANKVPSGDIGLMAS